MRQAIAQSSIRIGLKLRPIHRLKEKVAKWQALEAFRLGSRLRVDQLDLVAGTYSKRGSSLRAYAYPVDAGHQRQRTVGLDCYLESGLVQRGKQWWIELKERLPAGADDEPLS
jgi:hypothetical protein